LAAVLVRELALPFLVVMACCAWRDGNRREVWSWIAAIAAFAIAFAIHRSLVLAQAGSGDVASQGWLRFGGWQNVLAFVRESSFLGFLPRWVVATTIPLALLGWWSRRTPFTDRVTMVSCAYVLAFMVIGRPENFYWGYLVALLLVPGIALAPSAVLQLVRALRLPVGAPAGAPEFDHFA
jgi:hypothetical protein